MTDVVVVGAGISGLATAWFMQRRGASVVVLEAANEPGGSIRTHAEAGFLVDAGPTSTLDRGGVLSRLIEEVGLGREAIEAPRGAKRYIVKDGALVPLPMSLGGFLKTPLFSARAKWRLLAEPFRGRATAEETLARFVERRLGREFLDWAVDPFVSGVYAGDPARLSVRAALPRLYALEAEHGSLFRGALAHAVAGAGAGAAPRGRLLSFRGGMQTLPRAIAARLGDALHLNTPVAAIRRADRAWVVQSAAGEFHAPHLVLAVPAYQAAHLLATVAPAASAELQAIAYPSVASVALGFAREQVRHPLDGFGALLPRRLGVPTLGVLFSSSLFPGRAPAGRVLLTAFIGGAHNPALRTLPEPAIRQQVVEDLRPLLGLTGDPIYTRVTRWPYAIPQYELGHGERLARVDVALRDWPNLHLRANWRDGVSLADCVEQSAALAARLYV